MASPSFEPTETLTLPSQITYKPYNDTSPDRPTIYCSVYPDNTHRAMLTPVTLYSSFVHPTTHPLAYSECAAVLQSISRELSITYGNQSNIRPFVNMSSKQLNSLVQDTLYLFQEINHETLPDIVKSDVWGGIKAIDQSEMIELRAMLDQMKSDTKKDPPIRSYFCPIQQQREVLASYTSSGTTTYKNIDVVTDYAICQNVYIREPSTDENFSDAEDFSEIIQEQYPLDGRSKVPCIWDIEQLAERWGFKEKVGISPVWQSTANNIDFLYKPKSKANTSSLLDTAIDIEQRVDDWSLI